jgi:hypothetical protein
MLSPCGIKSEGRTFDNHSVRAKVDNACASQTRLPYDAITVFMSPLGPFVRRPTKFELVESHNRQGYGGDTRGIPAARRRANEAPFVAVHEFGYGPKRPASLKICCDAQDSPQCCNVVTFGLDLRGLPPISSW